MAMLGKIGRAATDSGGGPQEEYTEEELVELGMEEEGVDDATAPGTWFTPSRGIEQQRSLSRRDDLGSEATYFSTLHPLAPGAAASLSSPASSLDESSSVDHNFDSDVFG